MKKESSFSCSFLWTVIHLSVYFLFFKKIQNHIVHFIFFDRGASGILIGSLLCFGGLSRHYRTCSVSWSRVLNVIFTSKLLQQPPPSQNPTHISKCLQVSDNVVLPLVCSCQLVSVIVRRTMHLKHLWRFLKNIGAWALCLESLSLKSGRLTYLICTHNCHVPSSL